MKKTVLFLCAALVFALPVSCKKNMPSSAVSGVSKTESQPAAFTASDEEGELSLPYFSNDSVNPYSAVQSANFYIGTLLYDSLVEITLEFEAKPLLAKEIVHEGNVWTVTIRDNITFWDGSALTADDVVSSYRSAKKNGNYSSRLASVASCTAQGNSVVFVLNNPNRDFDKNLTFPITKGGSAGTLAAGSGRYMPADPQKPELLLVNKKSIRKIPKISSISLVEVHKYSQLPYMIKIGSVNFLYMNQPDTEVSTAAVKTSEVRMNQMLYLGINSSGDYLSNKDFRKAISVAIDRKSLLSDSYASRGKETASPFNPYATRYNGSYYSISSFDSKAAEELLSICGLITKNDEGKLLGTDENPVILRLAVNSDNKSRMRAAASIKQNLESVGIGVELIEEDAQTHANRVSSGNFDLFIGEIKLTADNNISTVLHNGAFNRCDDGGITLASYEDYCAEKTEIDEFLRTFDIQTPFVPLLYRNSYSMYSAFLSGDYAVTEYDIFNRISEWGL